MEYTIMIECAARQGWTTETQLDLSLEYISRQQDPDCFQDFLDTIANMENMFERREMEQAAEKHRRELGV